jgi:hypothetical protein
MVSLHNALNFRHSKRQSGTGSQGLQYLLKLSYWGVTKELTKMQKQQHDATQYNLRTNAT